jgi:hypothetical protein
MVVKRKRSREGAGKSMMSSDATGNLTMILLGCLCSNQT